MDRVDRVDRVCVDRVCVDRVIFCKVVVCKVVEEYAYGGQILVLYDPAFDDRCGGYAAMYGPGGWGWAVWAYRLFGSVSYRRGRCCQ